VTTEAFVEMKPCLSRGGAGCDPGHARHTDWAGLRTIAEPYQAAVDPHSAVKEIAAAGWRVEGTMAAGLQSGCKPLFSNGAAVGAFEKTANQINETGLPGGLGVPSSNLGAPTISFQ
jgi:hypothetical protein